MPLVVLNYPALPSANGKHHIRTLSLFQRPMHSCLDFRTSSVSLSKHSSNCRAINDGDANRPSSGLCFLTDTLPLPSECISFSENAMPAISVLETWGLTSVLS